MEIVNQRKAMESNAKRNDNFATKVIGMEKAEKKCKIVRRKNQTFFFSNLLTWKTSLKLPSLENY